MFYKIYYDDETVFHSHQARNESKHITREAPEIITPETTFVEMPPTQGVIAILQAKEKDREWELIMDKPYYFWNDEKWIGGDLWRVLAFFEEKGWIQYRVNNIKVKDNRNNRWNRANEIDLYAYLADTGLVLLGTGLVGKDLNNLLRQAVTDARERPVRTEIPKGARIRSRREASEKNRRLRPLR